MIKAEKHMKWEFDTDKIKHKFFFHQDTNIEHHARRRMRNHAHDNFEIYFITKGTCCYFIENKAYHLIPGDIVIIPTGVVHSTEYQNTVYSRMLINCADYYIPESVHAHLPEIIYHYRNPAIVHEIDAIFQKIKEESTNIDELSQDIFRCYTNMLFFLLIRNQNTITGAHEDKHYIDDALDFLQNNFASNVTLPGIAGRYFVSPEHFSRVFKAKTGFNFSEYLNILRLQRAEALLKQMTAAPITDIANACGFNDSNYFSLKFKELYGIPPKKFQSMNKG